MTNFEMIENYVAKYDDGWCANWNDPHQNKYYLYYCHKTDVWNVGCSNIVQSDKVYMSREMAYDIMALLNDVEERR